jgi:hypothetical protein
MQNRVGSAPRNGIPGNPSQTEIPRAAADPLAVRILGGPRGPPREMTPFVSRSRATFIGGGRLRASALTPASAVSASEAPSSSGKKPTMSIMNCHVPFIRTELALGGRDRSEFHADRPYWSSTASAHPTSWLRRKVVFHCYTLDITDPRADRISSPMFQGRSFARPPYLTPRPSSAARGCAGNISLATQPPQAHRARGRSSHERGRAQAVTMKPTLRPPRTIVTMRSRHLHVESAGRGVSATLAARKPPNRSHTLVDSPLRQP